MSNSVILSIVKEQVTQRQVKMHMGKCVAKMVVKMTSSSSQTRWKPIQMMIFKIVLFLFMVPSRE